MCSPKVLIIAAVVVAAIDLAGYLTATYAPLYVTNTTAPYGLLSLQRRKYKNATTPAPASGGSKRSLVVSNEIESLNRELELDEGDSLRKKGFLTKKQKEQLKKKKKARKDAKHQRKANKNITLVDSLTNTWAYASFFLFCAAMLSVTIMLCSISAFIYKPLSPKLLLVLGVLMFCFSLCAVIMAFSLLSKDAGCAPNTALGVQLGPAQQQNVKKIKAVHSSLGRRDAEISDFSEESLRKIHKNKKKNHTVHIPSVQAGLIFPIIGLVFSATVFGLCVKLVVNPDCCFTPRVTNICILAFSTLCVMLFYVGVYSLWWKCTPAKHKFVGSAFMLNNRKKAMDVFWMYQCSFVLLAAIMAIIIVIYLALLICKSTGSLAMALGFSFLKLLFGIMGMSMVTSYLSAQPVVIYQSGFFMGWVAVAGSLILCILICYTAYFGSAKKEEQQDGATTTQQHQPMPEAVGVEEDYNAKTTTEVEA